MAATIASGVPAATPHAPATTMTEIVEIRFRVMMKVIAAKEGVDKSVISKRITALRAELVAAFPGLAS